MKSSPSAGATIAPDKDPYNTPAADAGAAVKKGRYVADLSAPGSGSML